MRSEASQKKPKHASSKILIVDDNIVSVELIEVMLKYAGYTTVLSTLDPLEAVPLANDLRPDLVLLDLHMPRMSGLEVLQALRGIFPPEELMPILVFTSDGSPDIRNSALELGANDFLIKPGDFSEILLRVGNFLELRHCQQRLVDQQQHLEHLVVERTSELEESRREVIHRLARAAEFKDDDTGEHPQRVAALAADIAKHMGLSPRDVNLIRMASQLHDVGKVGIPDALLLRAGPLSQEEFELMKMHVDIGARILGNSHSPILQMAEGIARHHHEHWDGTGYPDNLSGESIPLAARITAVADVYDTLTSARPYRKRWPAKDAIEEIVAGSGTRFDPGVVQAFLAIVDSQDEGLELAA